MNNILLGERLRKLRLAGHYTQNYVSAHLHMARSSYCNYETGLRTPSLETLIQLAGFYNVTTDYLVGANVLNISPESTLSDEERRLLNTYRALRPKEQKELLFFGYFKKRLTEKHII